MTVTPVAAEDDVPLDPGGVSVSSSDADADGSASVDADTDGVDVAVSGTGGGPSTGVECGADDSTSETPCTTTGNDGSPDGDDGTGRLGDADLPVSPSDSDAVRAIENGRGTFGLVMASASAGGVYVYSNPQVSNRSDDYGTRCGSVPPAGPSTRASGRWDPTVRPPPRPAVT